MREDRQRLDQWLRFARFVKTRTLASQLIAAGHVRINGRRAEDAAKALAVGDVVTVALSRTTVVVRVDDLGMRRGPPAEARQLYTALVPSEGPLASDIGKS